MKKIMFTLLIGTVFAILCFLPQSSNATPGPYPNAIDTPCFGKNTLGQYYVKVTYDNTTYGYFGNSVFIWFQAGANLLGPVTPAVIYPNATTGYDYYYDLSYYSQFFIDSVECHRVYYFYEKTHLGSSDPTGWAWYLDVCPCPPRTSDRACLTNFSYTVNTNSPLDVQFTSQYGPFQVVFDGFTLTRIWDFGDGTTSNDANPMHTYPGFGSYTVCLTQQYINYDAGEEFSCYQCVTICIEEPESPYGLPGLFRKGQTPTTIANADIKLYPNPTKLTLQVEWSNKQNENADVVVLDVLGNTVLRLEHILVKGTNNMEINTSSLAPGNYTIHIKKAKSGTISQQFTVIK